MQCKGCGHDHRGHAFMDPHGDNGKDNHMSNDDNQRIGDGKRAAGFALIAAFALLVVGGIVTGITLAAVNHFSYEPEFRRGVRGHMENAYYANTPELMITELEAAKKGMHDLGLEPTMYDDLRPWKQNPAHQMSYQYAHIDSIINRAKDVQKWRDTQQEGASQLNDVYGAKMNDLRSFIKEDGWSDSIAKGAFYTNKHTFYAATNQFAGFIVGGYAVLALLLVGPAAVLINRANRERRQASMHPALRSQSNRRRS